MLRQRLGSLCAWSLLRITKPGWALGSDLSLLHHALLRLRSGGQIGLIQTMDVEHNASSLATTPQNMPSSQIPSSHLSGGTYSECPHANVHPLQSSLARSMYTGSPSRRGRQAAH